MILTRTKRKEFDADLEINLKIKERNLSSLLMIVPTNRRIRALIREMISRSPDKATGKINIETIGSVSSKLLFNSDSVKSNIINDAAAAIILQQSFSEVKLNYFSSYGDEIPKGTIERIRNVISEYKRHGISADKLKNEIESVSGTEKVKALDIAHVYEVYQRKIIALRQNETGDIYAALTALDDELFQQHFSSLYPGVNLIIIMGFDEFTHPEVQIINRLSKLEGAELFLSFDYYRFNPLIFSHLDSCYSNLIEKGFREITDKSISVYTRFQDEVRENLFLKKNDSLIENYKNKIKTISAPTREKEVELIASEIKELVLNQKVRPDQICIVFNLISNYSNIVRDIFPLYGLPFNLTDRFSLDTASPVVALISFLEIAENDFYYKNIFRALSGGILDIEGINVTNLIKASVNLKIISGFDNWQRTLNEALLSLQDDENDSYDVPVQINSYRSALTDIDKIRDYLNPFLRKMSISEFRENLRNLVNRLDIPVKIISSDPDEAEKDVKSVDVFLETTDEIIELLEEQYDSREKFSLKFYLHNLRNGISSSRYNVREKSGYGIQITTLNEIRGLKFDYLFIAGMCDGDFPTRFSPEIFFSGSLAKVKGEINHLTEQRYLFYQSLCAWNDKLYLTFPRRDERKEFVQSDFMREFISIFAITQGNERAYDNYLYTKEQLLTYIGRNGISNTEKLFTLNSAGINKKEIEEAMSIDLSRTEDPFAKNIHSGFLSAKLSKSGKDKLEKMKQRQFSISQLETYALCPYKYFAERVLKLDIFEEPTEEIEALELGSLIHSILFTFYTTLKQENILLSNCSNEALGKAEKLLFNIAESKVNEINFNSPLSFFEREKIFGIEGNRKNSILYKFLIAERENDEGYIPAFFETGFGRVRGEEDQKIPVEELKADGIKVRGKIDRVDLNKDEKTYKVFDYKTGKSRLNKQDIINGLQLQLPLYLYAAKEIIKSELNEDYEPAGALIYSLKYDSIDFGRDEVSFGRKATEEEIKKGYKELIEICLAAINRYVDGIGRGDFRLSQIDKREEKACRFCSFRSICRIQEAG